MNNQLIQRIVIDWNKNFSTYDSHSELCDAIKLIRGHRTAKWGYSSADLTRNREWNTKIISTEQGEIAKEIIEEFNALWISEYALEFEEFFELYKERYQIIKRQREIAKAEKIPSIEKYRLQPNSMQVGFITNLRKMIADGAKRAFLVSATGARVILLTGRNALIFKGFGPVFSIYALSTSQMECWHSDLATLANVEIEDFISALDAECG